MRSIVSMAIVCLLLISTALPSENAGDKLSTEPLTKDAIAIYRELIKHYLHESKTVWQLNIANETEPLAPSAFFSGTCGEEENTKSLEEFKNHEEFGFKICIGLDVSNINIPKKDENVQSIVHKLDKSVISGLSAILVNSDAQNKKILSFPRLPTGIVGPNKPSEAEIKRRIDDLVQQEDRAGFFSLSEILYDEGRQYAAVTYRFTSHIHEETKVILKKESGKWKVLRTGLGALEISSLTQRKFELLQIVCFGKLAGEIRDTGEFQIAIKQSNFLGFEPLTA